MPKSFSEEFKKNIVNSYKRGESISSICRDHNISKTTVYNWVRLYTPTKTKGKLIFTGREVHLLKQELSLLKEENSILRQCNCSIYSSIPDKIREIKKLDKKYSYHSLCRALDIRRSVLYYHLNYRKDETVFEQDDKEMKPLIKEIFEESHERFGSRMIRVKILEMGITISQERTARLMKEMGLVCNSSKKLLPEYKREYPYSRSSYCINKLGRKFQQEHPNLVWVSDITYLRTREGIYYLCVILGVFPRFCVNSKMII